MSPSSPPSIHDLSARVIENRDLGASHFLLTLQAEPVAAAACPGQFAMLRFAGRMDPLLPRPMSISDVLPADGSHPVLLQILHKVVGRGTQLLAALKPGERLQVLGPLGKPFSVPSPVAPGSQALMVAGGIGVAIFPFLVPMLQRAGLKPVLLFGARSSRELVRKDWFARQGVEVRTATEDGSEGAKGFVTTLLQEALGSSPEVAIVYACGPQAMLKAVGEMLIASGVSAQLSLESYMGCGIGACLGCVVKVRRDSGFAYARICVEGPTFPASEVLW
ncbi:MAG: dihydroorotate dehydrogenase electron transfer subunit [Acidobacteria bacterium]|nr:dihydroorotate dehydrogenase electron transfer subunit [Acidobacteriota bacterium]